MSARITRATPRWAPTTRSHGATATTAAAPSTPRWATRAAPIASRCSRPICSAPSRWPPAGARLPAVGDRDPPSNPSARRVQRGSKTGEVGRPEDHAISRRDIHEIEIDPGARDPARQVGQHSWAVLDIDHDDLALAGDSQIGDAQQMLRGPGMRDEDVKLRTLAGPDARGRCDVHAGI